jgi:hypothetical protein
MKSVNLIRSLIREMANLPVPTDEENRREYERLLTAGMSSWMEPEKGTIRLWGDLLYLVYGGIPRGLGDEDEVNEFVSLASEYFRSPRGSEAAEDIMDWITDAKGCKDPETGIMRCSRSAIDSLMSDAADMTRTKAPLLVRRTGRFSPDRWLSFTVGEAYSESAGESNTEVHEILINPGTPVIAAGKLADPDEIIAKLPTGSFKVLS